ncbi:MAG: hypothetical protein ACYDDF_04180 [Thermoplasmatota archaeon]
MGVETRVWGSKGTPNLFTTVPRTVRDQLALGPEDRVVWRLDGSTAELRRAEAAQGGTHVLYKQARSNSLYVAIPVAVAEQLRFSDRARAEWELLGSSARVRRA